MDPWWSSFVLAAHDAIPRLLSAGNGQTGCSWSSSDAAQHRRAAILSARPPRISGILRNVEKGRMDGELFMGLRPDTHK